MRMLFLLSTILTTSFAYSMESKEILDKSDDCSDSDDPSSDTLQRLIFGLCDAVDNSSPSGEASSHGCEDKVADIFEQARKASHPKNNEKSKD
jgi:hypothetical protein